MRCTPSTGTFEIACSSPSGSWVWSAESDHVRVPLVVLGPLPSVRPSVGSRNPPPMPSLLMLPQLCMLFQSTYEERQGAEASAEQGERIARSSLQHTLTAEIMGRWTKHNRAPEHLVVTRSVEMMELQRAQRFPACTTYPDTSVFAEFFPAPQPAPSQPNAPSEKEKQMHINWNLLAFLSDLSARGILTRFPPDVRQAFSAGAWGPLFPRCLLTLKAARCVPARCVLILWVIMSSLASSTQVLSAVTIISCIFWLTWCVLPT